MKPMTKDRDGLTGPQWLRQQFQYENCAECRRGARSHSAVPLLGNWFAYCKPVCRNYRKGAK